MSIKHKVKQFLIIILLGILGIVTIFPIYFLIVNSFKSQQEIVASPIKLPSSWNFDYLKNAAEKINIGGSLLNTIIITVIAVALIVLVASVAAWAMVRTRSKASKILFLVFTSAMLIPFQSLMYPLVSFMETIGLKNSTGLVVMYGGFGISMSVLLYHGFIKSIPISLEEAAMLDGATISQVYRHIIMPLIKPTTVTVIITNGVWIWNDYLLPFLVVGNTDKKTLTLSLYYAKSLSGQYGNPWELIFPAVLLCVIPIIIIFIFIQRQIIEGISAGAVKG